MNDTEPGAERSRNGRGGRSGRGPSGDDRVPAMTKVWDRSAATGTDRLVLLGLAKYADPDGTRARPSYKRLADEAGIDVRTVRRCVRRLEWMGELHVEHGAGRHGTNLHTILCCRDAGHPAPGEVADPRTRVQQTPGTGAPEPGHRAPQPLMDHPPDHPDHPARSRETEVEQEEGRDRAPLPQPAAAGGGSASSAGAGTAPGGDDVQAAYAPAPRVIDTELDAAIREAYIADREARGIWEAYITDPRGRGDSRSRTTGSPDQASTRAAFVARAREVVREAAGATQ